MSLGTPGGSTKLADDLPLRSSREAIVDRLIQGVRRHFSTLTEACECIRGVVPELSEAVSYTHLTLPTNREV